MGLIVFVGFFLVWIFDFFCLGDGERNLREIDRLIFIGIF